MDNQSNTLESKLRTITLGGVECTIVAITEGEVCYTRADRGLQAFPISCKADCSISIGANGEEIKTFTISDEAIVEAFNAPKLVQEQSLASKLYAVYISLPVAVRGAFAPAWVVVNEALKLGDYELATYTIKNAVVPEELQTYKDSLIGMFPPELTA